MKKLVSVLMAAAMILCMAACGNDEKVIGEEAQSGAQSGEAQSGQSGSQGSYSGRNHGAGGCGFCAGAGEAGRASFLL